MRVFLDANIIFSAAWSGNSPTHLLFELAGHQKLELYSSAFALEEVQRNLTLKRASCLSVLKKLTQGIEVCPEPGHEHLTQARMFALPEKDVPILAAALISKADVLVTGDKTHFGHLFGNRVGGVRVLTLADTLALALKNPADTT